MSQIDKNTVSAKGQLKPSQFVSFDIMDNAKIKVLFVGNSITLHGIKPDIGWNYSHGMAATTIENDYVHIVMKELSKKYGETSFCICQVAEWERQYKKGSEILNLFDIARDFEADIIIMRLAENCPVSDFDAALFKSEYQKLFDYLNSKNSNNVVITTSFWKHPADAVIAEFANEHSFPLAYLGELGEMDEMKAVGLFEHSGVAAHPGDKGMRAIAEEILKLL